MTEQLVSDGATTFAEDLKAIAAAIGHRGMTLTALREAQAEIAKPLNLDEHISIQEQHRRLVRKALERSGLLDDVRAAIEAREAAKTGGDLRNAEAAVKKAWAAFTSRTGEIWEKVCPPEPKKPKFW